MKNVLSLAAIALSCVVTSATAQEFKGGSFGLAFDRITWDGGEQNATSFEGRGSFGVGEMFTVDLIFSQHNADWDDGPFEGNTKSTLFGVRPSVEVAPGAMIGVYFDHVSFDDDGFEADGKLMGIEGSFAVGETVTISGYVGRTESDDFADFDIRNVGLKGEIDLGNGLNAGVFMQSDTVEDGRFEEKVQETGLSLEMDLSERAGVPVTVFARVGQLKYEGYDSEPRVTIGANFTLGGQPPNGFLGDHFTGHGLAGLMDYDYEI